MKALALMMLVLGCGQVAFADFKVGMPVCLTTSCSAEGDNSVKGAQLAVQALNEKGGVLGEKVTLMVEDTAEGVDAARAVSAYKKLRTNPQIKYFIGPNWTPAGLAIAPIAAKEDVIVTSPSLGVKEFASGGKNIFNVNGPDEAASRGLAELAVRKGWKRAAIFSSQQPWDASQAVFFEEEYRRLGGTVATKQEPLPDALDLRSEAMKIIAAKPDVVFFSNISGQFPVAVKLLREFHYQGRILAVWLDEKFVALSDGAAEGAISCRLTEPKLWFVDKFRAAYGAYPERAAYGAYDTLMIYADSIAKAGSFDPRRVMPVIGGASVDGASGAFAFDQDGNARRAPAFKQIQHGEFVPYR